MKNFYRDGGLIISVAALVAAAGMLELYVYSQNTRLFWITLPFVVLIAGFAVGKLIQITRRTVQYNARINAELDNKQRMSIYTFPIAAVVTDSLDRIVWCNDMFEQEFPDACEYGTQLSKITDAKPKSFFERDGKVIRYNDKVFRVFARVPDDKDENTELTLLFFRNITEYTALRTEKRLSQPVVMLIMVDGYEELISGSPESEKAHVSVQIDKLLEDFIGQTSGILRKIASDRFVAVVEERHIAKMIEGKLAILDKAREIFVNDRVNVTLSIGVGRNGKTLTESEKIAQQALEMALGRGGDQAAIKTESGFEFYGGVSKGIERQAKVRTRIIAHSLLNMADAADKIYIMGHKFSDLDSVGSCVGLTCALRNLGKNAHTVCDRESSLAKELIDLFPAAGETDDPMIISPDAAIEGMTDDTLLIITDTHNPKILENAQPYEQAKKVVVIDHHRRMVNCIENAAIFHHEPYASSASEMVTELLQYFGEAGKLKAYQAECLLAGIMLDTKNFVMRTGVRTFEAAAVLRKMGADTITVKKLFSNSMESYKKKTKIVADAEIYRQCAIAPCDFFAEDMRIIAPQAADELLSIKNVDASFVLYPANEEVSISARSMGLINVQLIMEALGGGGHQTMAGVQLKNCTVEQAKQALCQAIDSYFASNAKPEN